MKYIYALLTFMAIHVAGYFLSCYAIGEFISVNPIDWPMEGRIALLAIAAWGSFGTVAFWEDDDQ